MRLLFMGTPDFAATILAGLIAAGHEIAGVVTQPDKQKGRGQEVGRSPVKELALLHGLTVYQPVKVKEADFLDEISALKLQAVIVAAFGQILPKALLDIPEYGCINVHASLLPKYRGAAPIQYSILNGEKETGITIMYMDVGIDTGDIILQKSIPIEPKETGGSLFDKLSVLGSDLLIEALQKIENKTALRIVQDPEKATYVKIISKEMGRLDFSQEAVKLERQVRGLNPWPSAYTFLDGKTLKIWQAEAEADKNPDEGIMGAVPGEITEVSKASFTIKTGKGSLIIRELQLEGKKRMSADAFLRGYTILAGTKLG